jgi:hypothetical protein
MKSIDKPTRGIVWKNGSAVFLARVVGWDGVVLQKADLASITYTAKKLVDDVWTDVTGHVAATLAIADVISDALVTDDERWTVDSTGYNFVYLLDTTAVEAFDDPDAKYLVSFSFTPTGQPPVKVVFELDCRPA